MTQVQDIWNRLTRLTDERLNHLETNHPEMQNQMPKITETLTDPDCVLHSQTGMQVELFYKHYPLTPVTSKFLCVVVKVLPEDGFIITAYFTDAVKKGDVLWEKK